MYEMKEEYLTGIKMIDEEHRRLFEIADEVYELSKNEFIPDKYDNIRHIIESLREYTLLHFEHEEAYMESIGYKKMFTQKIEHDAFREQIASWDLETIEDQEDETILKITSMLTDWLINHIFENDKLIGKD